MMARGLKARIDGGPSLTCHHLIIDAHDRDRRWVAKVAVNLSRELGTRTSVTFADDRGRLQGTGFVECVAFDSVDGWMTELWGADDLKPLTDGDADVAS